MPSGLHFLLMGVARSGTTAVTDALNAAPRIFCGMEVLPDTASGKGISFPRSFERRVHMVCDAHRASLARLLEEKRGAATIIGNKHPSYYLTVERLTAAAPDLRTVFIYRAPAAFLNSWNRRADDPADPWHKGRRGVFGVLTLLAYLRVLARLRTPSLMVCYDAFCRDIAGSTGRIADYLGDCGHGAPLDALRIRRLQSAADTLAGLSRPVSAHEAALLAAMRLDALSQILAAGHLKPFASVRREVHRYCRSVEGIWGEAILRAVAAYDEPAAVRYLLKMLHTPVIADMFAEEAALSPTVRQCLAGLPRALKLRTLLLRQSPEALCESSLARLQAALW